MRVRQFYWLTALILGVPSLSCADDATVQDVQSCESIIEASARLACYDKVASGSAQERVQPEEQVVSDPGEPQEEYLEDGRFVPLTDEVGLTQVQSGASKEPQPIRATVTKCQAGADGKTLFYFDNGQVWKQVDAGRQRMKECEFVATITRDAFGFRMQPEGQTSRVRIKRIK